MSSSHPVTDRTFGIKLRERHEGGEHLLVQVAKWTIVGVGEEDWTMEVMALGCPLNSAEC